MKQLAFSTYRPVFFAKFVWLTLFCSLNLTAWADDTISEMSNENPPEMTTETANATPNQDETIGTTIAEIRQISEEIRQLNQEIQQNKALLQQLSEEQNTQPSILASQINLNSVVAPEIPYSTLDGTLQQVANVESEQALLALNEEIHQLSEEIRQLNEDISKGKQVLEQLNQDTAKKKINR